MSLLPTLLAVLDNSDVNLPTLSANRGAVSLIMSLVWGTAASLCILFIVIGAIKYILSNGDPGQVSSAKNTIIYAVIGLVITMSGFAIINFVSGRLG